jgi:hypothetical protein
LISDGHISCICPSFSICRWKRRSRSLGIAVDARQTDRATVELVGVVLPHAREAGILPIGADVIGLGAAMRGIASRRRRAAMVLSRFAPSAGFVSLRQTFVLRCHGGNCPGRGSRTSKRVRRTNLAWVHRLFGMGGPPQWGLITALRALGAERAVDGQSSLHRSSAERR